MRRSDRGKGSNGNLDRVRIRGREHITTVETTHAVGNDVGLLARIEGSRSERHLDLISQLVAAESYTLRRIELRGQYEKPIRTKMLSNASKIVDYA